MHSRVADTALVSFQSGNQAVYTLEVNLFIIDRLSGSIVVECSTRGQEVPGLSLVGGIVLSLGKAFHPHYLIVTT